MEFPLNMTTEYHSKKAYQAIKTLERAIQYERDFGDRESLQDAKDLLQATKEMDYENSKKLIARDEYVQEVNNLQGAYI